MCRLADYQMVEHSDFYGAGGIYDAPRQNFVFGRRRRIAAGMIVDENQAGGVMHQRELYDSPRIDDRVVDRSFVDDVVSDDVVLYVQIDHHERFVCGASEFNSCEVDDRLG